MYSIDICTSDLLFSKSHNIGHEYMGKWLKPEGKDTSQESERRA